MAKTDPIFLTAKEAAARLEAGESSVRLWAKDGKFPGARLETSPVGSYWLIPESALTGFSNPGRGRPSKQAPDKPTLARPKSSRNGAAKVTAKNGKPVKKG